MRTCAKVLVRAALFVGVVPAVAPRYAQATTVEPMTLGTAADLAAQVIDGRVIHTQARWVENPRRIETVVTFGDVDFLKGETIGGAEDGTFELVVPGGSISGMQMRIAGAPDFVTGDRWILFLLPTYKTHPVVGLTAGAFRVVESTNGTTEVRDAEGRPVGLIHSDGAVVVAGDAQLTSEVGLVGAENIRVRKTPHKVTRPMSRDEFVTALRPLLTVSRRHAITHPAGRPDPVILRPTAIQPSELEQRSRGSRGDKASRGESGQPAHHESGTRRAEQ